MSSSSSSATTASNNNKGIFNDAEVSFYFSRFYLKKKFFSF
jgi:hypothetical protein